MLRDNLLQSKRLLNPLRPICCVLFTAAVSIALPAHSATPLITFEAATSNGLQRSWFSQIQVDPTRNLATSWSLHNDRLFALTSAGTVHVLDSETGETLWVAQVGTPNHPLAGPAVNAGYVALLGGSRLYVLDRGDGHLLWSRNVGGAAVASPALSETYVYVALLSGRVEGFRLDDPTAAVWQYQSVGRVFQSPITTGGPISTGSFLTWTTDRGYLYVGDAARPRVLFRVDTNDEIASAPLAQNANLYATSLGGYLYCYHASTGSELWRYSTGYPVTNMPAVVSDKVYVASEAPALYAIDSETGRHQWVAEGVAQFVSQGANRVYGTNRFGTLLILDRESGARAGRLAVSAGTSALSNDQSDRIYLVSDRGLVQCLHEIGATEPTHYRSPLSDEDMPGEQKKEAKEGSLSEETQDEAVEAGPEGESNEDDDTPIGSDEGNVFDNDNPFQ